MNNHPPEIKASSRVGIVEENSEVGTVVRSLNGGGPIVFEVVDGDLVSIDKLFGIN